MKRPYKLLIFLYILFGLQACENLPKTDLTKMPLIPLPVSVNANGEAFVLNEETPICILGNEDVKRVGEYLSVQLKQVIGVNIEVLDSTQLTTKGICLSLENDTELGEEGYQLTIGKKQIKLEANTPAGLSRGAETILQLLPAEMTASNQNKIIIPGGVIRDYPEYKYRAAMLDVSRHFFPVDDVKSFIDMLAFFKFNYCHLHLSDDQGWRIEIKSWPNLTQHGGSTQVGGGEGGYYTQAQYCEIVSYAAQRNITIIPEIDMPGHTNAALASYAELNGDGKKQELYTGTDVGFSTLCAKKDITYKFIDDVITELAAITPGPFIHIGGDESLATKKDDYKYFIEKVQKIVSAHGKTMIGWEETASCNLDTNTVVGYWKSPEDARIAAKKNLKLILLPASKAYLDMKYDTLTTLGLHWAGYINIDTAYNWNPATIISGISKENIFGIEAPLWSETITNLKEIQYMVLPRLSAYAEIGWCNNEKKDLNDYKSRLAQFANRFKNEGWNYYPSKLINWKE